MRELPERILTQDDESRIMLKITPSKIGPWTGARSMAPGFTEAQVSWLGQRGLDPETVDRMHVRVVASDFLYDQSRYSRAIRMVLCPIVGHARGRIRVVTPYGFTASVWPGGHLKRPPSAIEPSRLRSGLDPRRIRYGRHGR